MKDNIVWKEIEHAPRKPSYKVKVDGITLHISEYGGWSFHCTLEGLALAVTPDSPHKDWERKHNLEFCKADALNALRRMQKLGAKPHGLYERND